jgi:prolyl-tRNA synthetase
VILEKNCSIQVRIISDDNLIFTIHTKLDKIYNIVSYFRGVPMRVSKLVGRTLREDPKDVKLVSHKFLLRGAYVRQVASGIYSLLPIGMQIKKKIEAIIREEMNAIEGQEVLLPVVMPRDLWDEAGRYESVGSEMLRFRDRNNNEMLLGMTHEEPVVHLARTEIVSYKQLPVMMYQIQTKFRDEARSRGGLIRVREFTMKDAYSFHTNNDDLEEYYKRAHKAYERIFTRVGLKNFVDVESDSGMIGGSVSHEFMLVTPFGEDTLIMCEKCGYRANKEIAVSPFSLVKEDMNEMEKVPTPEKKTIEEVSSFLGVKESQTAKAVFYMHDNKQLVFVLIRGDLDVNDNKLNKILGTGELRPATDEEIKAAGSVPGYASPVGLDPKLFSLIVDPTVSGSSNLVTGANEKDFHYVNFNYGRDLQGGVIADVAVPREGDPCPECSEKLNINRGIEIGNIFQLGTKYSKPMGCTFLDENGKSKTAIMGCYGIGVGRLLASVMEENHDDWGPIWPVSIAPWQVQICSLDMKKPGILDESLKIYNELKSAGIDVLWDDRNEKAGVQFKDADLRGIPFRLILSVRNIKNGQVEFKVRGSRDSEKWPLNEVSKNIIEIVENAKNKMSSVEI